MNNLNLFDLSIKRNVVDKETILKRVNNSKNINIVTPKQKHTSVSLIDLIKQSYENVDKYLGDKKDKYELVTSEDRLNEYIDKIISFGYYGIDTETTGVNPMIDHVVGFSLYVPGEKAIYVPVEHISYITKEKLPQQVSNSFASKTFKKLDESTAKSIFFNAKFDIRMIWHSFGVKLTPYFDGLVAARILNENEPTNGLKQLHKKYILKNKEDAFSFGELFNGICFDQIPPNVGYIYAARDAEITYELYEFQNKYLTKGTNEYNLREMSDLSELFWNIEMPMVKVLADLEDTGVLIDQKRAKELYNHYVPAITACEEKFNSLVQEYGISKKYDISSSKQLAELFYDVLGLVSPNPEKPRGTGKDIIAELHHPIVDAVKDYRALSTLVNTFVTKLPTIVDPVDKRIHCHYNQLGTDTGRLACHDPNMQNIPSHAGDIRTMFCASTEYEQLSSNSDNSFNINICSQIKTPTGWKRIKDIKINDEIYIKNNGTEVCVHVSTVSNRDENTICINWQ